MPCEAGVILHWWSPNNFQCTHLILSIIQ